MFSMNVRHRTIHHPASSAARGGSHGHRSRSRRRINQDNIGIVAIVVFVLAGLVLFLFFDFHHHEYDIDTGAEVVEVSEEDEPPLEDPPESNVAAAAAAAPPNGMSSSRDGKVNLVGGSEAAAAPNKGGSLRGGAIPEGGRRPSRVVTVLLPSIVNPNGRTERLRAIADTWGPSARAVFVVHDAAEFPGAAGVVGGAAAEADSSSLAFPRLLVVPPSITVDQGVPRLQHVVRTVLGSLDPDFAFFVNDHTYVIPEHLCSFLSEHDPSKELYAGHAMKNEKEGYAFNSGAAGYVLSRKTMHDLVRKWDERDPKCLAEHAAKWLQGNPGLVTAKCLRESMHVNAVDTRTEGGRHAFHAFGLVRTVSGRVDEWYLNKHKGLDTVFGPDGAGHQHMPLKGVECCSTRTVSFHYVEGAETRALYELRSRLKSNAAMSDKELKEAMISLWPQGHDVGGYSSELPPDNDDTAEWDILLAVLRIISSPGDGGSLSSPLC